MSLYHIDCLYNDLLLDYNSPGSPTQPLLLWFAVYFLNEVEKTDQPLIPLLASPIEHKQHYIGINYRFAILIFALV